MYVSLEKYQFSLAPGQQTTQVNLFWGDNHPSMYSLTFIEQTGYSV